MLSRGTALALGVVFVLILLTTTAHLHPASEFSLPLLPSSWGQVAPHTPDPAQAENRHLSATECAARYPDLYREADRARDHWEAKGGIAEETVDEAEKRDASARLAIIDNKLYVKSFFGGINSRTQAAIAAVYGTLLTSPEPLPDADFVIQTSDAGGGEYAHFVLDRKESQRHLWLMPDFGFFSWPEPGVGAYTEVRDSALEMEQALGLDPNDASTYAHNWAAKVPKLMWRGSPMVEVRQELLRASENHTWSDVRSLDWDHVNEATAADREAHDGDIKSPAEHCQYAFLAHVEGWAYSGRLKYLQQCRSIIVTHPLEYIQHFHHLLNGVDGHPGQNMVVVRRPLEQHLAQTMEDLLAPGPESAAKVQRILKNGWEVMREGYLSPAANECYHRYALRAYAGVQRFRPSRGAGVPYESFVLMGSTQWEPHRR